MIRTRNPIRNLLVSWLMVLLSSMGMAMAQDEDISVPEFDPTNVDSGWIGSTICKFQPIGILQGRIMYTLDGTHPEQSERNSTRQYTNAGIPINQSCWVKAIHVQGRKESYPAMAHFQRARTPNPVPAYGGNPKFHPSLACTLNIAPTRSAATIRYTRDGNTPTATSPVYAAPFLITKSETLRAYAIAEGYDMSDVIQVAFTYLEPPPAPIVTPGSRSFSTGTLTLKVACPSAATSCRWSDKPGIIDLATAGNLLTSDSVTIHGGNDGDTITFRAQAFRTGYPSSPVTTMKYVYLPAVAAPTIYPAPTTFYDTIRVRMSSATLGADIRYVEDNSVPAKTSKDGNGDIVLDKSVTLSAIAFKGDQPASLISKFPFTLRLTPPSPDRPSQEYVDSLKIRLFARNARAFIFYSLNGVPPAIVNGKPTGIQYDPAKGVVVSAAGTTVVSAIAVLDGIASNASSNSYVKKEKVTTLVEPRIDPPGVEFIDTLSVKLSAEDPNSEIRYTLSADGEEPTKQSLLAVPGTSIRLDETRWLWSRAFPINGLNLEPSPIRKDRYTVLPSQPVASPMPLSPFPNSVTVTLRSQTKHGIIHYTVNDASRNPVTTQGYKDSVKVTLSSTSTLRAVTVVGAPPNDHFSTTLTLTYEIYTTIVSDTVAPGATRTLSGGYAFLNNSAAPMIAKVRTTEGMGLVGFNNLSLAITLQSIQPGGALKAAFAKPADSPVALYRETGGKVEFVTAENRMDLTQAGDYFLGIDALPPVITLVKQVPAPGVSTTVHLQITDNVSGPACEITSPGIKNGKTAAVPDAEGIVKVNIQSGAGDPAGLWLQAAARDRFNTGTLPADPQAKLYLTQIWPKLATPAVWTIGQGEDLWDMAGFPVAGAAPIKWSQLRTAHAGLQACIWNGTTYVPLEDTAEFRPGRAVWLGSRSKFNSLNLTQFRAGESQADGTWRIRIKPGWNQVTSPSLERVYWPVTLAQSKLGQSQLKAPYRFVRGVAQPWVQVDSLDPWIGYFVLYYGTEETEITVYSDPAKRAAAAKSAADRPSAAGMDLSLDPGMGLPVRLGARTWALDGIGTEDEPNLPALRPAFSAWALRGRRNLMTDVVRFLPGEVHHWNVVLDPGAAGTAPSVPGKVAGSLPGGYEAWAVSRLRGLKFRLEPGHPWPASDAADTLSVYAGPAEKLSAIGELARASTRVENFSFTLEKSRGSAWLRLDLPWAAEVEATVWGVDGKRLASHRAGSLNSGIYRLRLERGTDAQPAMLRLTVRTPEGTREHSRRLVW